MSNRHREEAILIIRKNDRENLDEILAVTREAGFEPKHVIEISNVDSTCYLTYGKLTRVKYIIRNDQINKLCIYDQLKPRQFSCLMKELGVEVIDKVILILRVFQMHAGSREAMLQIELARLMHELPIIREWIRRSKLGELPGFLSSGRYAIDYQYAHIRRRIARIRKELEELRLKRERERERRKESGWAHIAIIGYTNAGKTTLFNALTKLNKPTGTEMFTTLSPKTYAINVCKDIGNDKVVLVDTIGFIKDLPLEIVEAFKAVLEEIKYSDILLLVIDISKRKELIINDIESVLNILHSVGIEGKPIIVALNKIDLINKENGVVQQVIDEIREYLLKRNINLYSIIAISAYYGLNIDMLKESLCQAVQQLKNSETKYMF